MSFSSKIQFMSTCHKIICSRLTSQSVIHCRKMTTTSPSAFVQFSTNLSNESVGSTKHTSGGEASIPPPPQENNSKFKSSKTYSAEEVDKFRRMSDEWWKPNGDLQTLHTMNMLRVPLVRDGLLGTGDVEQSVKDGPRPLQGFRILDVGCGGGVLSEPLARLGAHVTGLDAAEEGIEAAKIHAQKDPKICKNVNYFCDSIEDHVAELEQPYDAVIASEVVEHVASLEIFLDACCKAVRPGGSVFITTMNRTPQSLFGAIVMAEYVLGLLPRGTHDWSKFVPVDQLKDLLNERGLHTRLVHGMFYNPVANSWCWVKDTGINYALHAVKREEPRTGDAQREEPRTGDAQAPRQE